MSNWLTKRFERLCTFDLCFTYSILRFLFLFEFRVLQVYVLGPVHYVMYTADIHHFCRHCYLAFSLQLWYSHETATKNCYRIGTYITARRSS